MLKHLILLAGSILLMSATTTDDAQAASPENTMYMTLSTGGTITIEMLPDIAPGHVERIKKLARDGFYDGIVFHRVIEGFMAQTGDPTGTGMGGSDEPNLKAEFTDYPYKRGTIGMARTQSPDSANSQFFFCFTDTGCSFLTGQYTVWGQVTEGMEEIDKIALGEPPAEPDKIEKITIGSDITEDISAQAEEPAVAEDTEIEPASGEAENAADNAEEAAAE